MKYSLAIAALLGNVSAVALEKHSQFAEGMGRMEHHGESITMKGNGKMDNFNYLQMEATPYKGEEFKNSPSTATVPEYSIPIKSGQAAVNRRNGQPDMGITYGEKQW
jgi:hypothetical protein